MSTYYQRQQQAPAAVDAGGSYMQAFEKSKQHKPEYKPYTMNDYKKLRTDIRLGGLGPEIESEEIKEKVSCFETSQYDRMVF